MHDVRVNTALKSSLPQRADIPCNLMAHYGSSSPQSDERWRKAGGGLTRFSIRRFRYPEGFCPSLASQPSSFVDRLTGTRARRYRLILCGEEREFFYH